MNDVPLNTYVEKKVEQGCKITAIPKCLKLQYFIAFPPAQTYHSCPFLRRPYLLDNLCDAMYNEDAKYFVLISLSKILQELSRTIRETF